MWSRFIHLNNQCRSSFETIHHFICACFSLEIQEIFQIYCIEMMRAFNLFTRLFHRKTALVCRLKLRSMQLGPNQIKIRCSRTLLAQTHITINIWKYLFDLIIAKFKPCYFRTIFYLCISHYVDEIFHLQNIPIKLSLYWQVNAWMRTII